MLFSFFPENLMNEGRSCGLNGSNSPCQNPSWATGRLLSTSQLVPSNHSNAAHNYKPEKIYLEKNEVSSLGSEQL